VAFAKNGEILVGEVAKRQGVTTSTGRSGRSSAIWVQTGPSTSTVAVHGAGNLSARARQTQGRCRGLPR
jgi:hypothetical protein